MGQRHRSRYPLLYDEAWLRQKYEAEELTQVEIAVLAGGCSTALVWCALRFYNIEARPRGRRDGGESLDNIEGRPNGRGGRRPSFPQLHDAGWLAERRAAGSSAGAVAVAIAGELGCSVSYAGNALRKFGLSRPAAADYTQSPHYGQAQLLEDEGWLTEQYLVQDRKSASIARELCVTREQVTQAIHQFGMLKPRSRRRPRRGRDADLPPVCRRTEGGYVKVRMPGHPHANRHGWVFQHLLVCEEALGRPLADQELIHHINQRREDNRADNLLVVPDRRTLRALRQNQPPWVPRCGCCGRPQPEAVTSRPSWVPLVYDAAAVYSAGPEDAADYCI